MKLIHFRPANKAQGYESKWVFDRVYDFLRVVFVMDDSRHGFKQNRVGAMTE